MTDSQRNSFFHELGANGFTDYDISGYYPHQIDEISRLRADGCSWMLLKQIESDKISKLSNIHQDGFSWKALERIKRKLESNKFLDDFIDMKETNPEIYLMCMHNGNVVAQRESNVEPEQVIPNNEMIPDDDLPPRYQDLVHTWGMSTSIMDMPNVVRSDDPPPIMPVLEHITSSTHRSTEQLKIIETAGFCAFCQDDFDNKKVVITECHHVYCADCYYDDDNDEWQTKCTICRKDNVRLI